MKVFKVVKFNEVEQWTFQGWEFVMVVTQSLAQTVPCSTPYMNRDNNYGPQYASRDEIVQVHEALFMLSKDSGEILREGVLTMERDVALQEARAAKERLSGATQRAESATVMAGEYQTRYDQLNLKLGEEMVRIRKLEGDLGKVRTAIGTKAFEEAIKP